MSVSWLLPVFQIAIVTPCTCVQACFCRSGQPPLLSSQGVFDLSLVILTSRCTAMVQRIRYFKTDNAENEVSDEQLRSCNHELEVEPFPAPARQQGLALLLSLQQIPQLKGHSLEVRAPLGQSTIWRPLQEIRVVPQGVLDIKAVKGMHWQQRATRWTLTSMHSCYFEYLTALLNLPVACRQAAWP